MSQDKKQNRFKSKAAWLSLAALILFVLKNYGLLEPIGLTIESYKEFTTLVFAALVSFGILNNPTDSEKF